MQPCEGLSHRQPTTARYVNDFGRRQGVYIYWILGLDGREEVFIVVNIQVRVEATLHQDPRPPKFQRLFYLGEYLLGQEEIFAKIEETLELGGTGILMQGGLHPDLDIHYYADLFAAINAKYPIDIHP